jgi:hypothetical protein
MCVAGRFESGINCPGILGGSTYEVDHQTGSSSNRLKTSSSDFAAYVEAPAPEHNHEAQTSERTLTPAMQRDRS